MCVGLLYSVQFEQWRHLTIFIVASYITVHKKMKRIQKYREINSIDFLVGNVHCNDQ